MTCLIEDEAQSVLAEGIETIVVRLHHERDLGDLAFHANRGGTYSVVEWLLTQLYRPMEIDRVCGLTITPTTTGEVMVSLELRQPAKQIEAWIVGAPAFKVLRIEGQPDGSATITTESGGHGNLCARSLSTDKFTDKYRPYWEIDLPDINQELDDADAASGNPDRLASGPSKLGA